MSVLMALGNTHNKHYVTHNKPVNFNAQAQTKINNISKKKKTCLTVTKVTRNRFFLQPLKNDM